MMDARALDRFRKVCGLLASQHDGERATAALQATMLLRKAELTWADVGIAPSASALGALAQAHSDAAMAAVYKMSLDSERARTTRQQEEINRLNREVARLKGMWRKEPA